MFQILSRIVVQSVVCAMVICLSACHTCWLCWKDETYLRIVLLHHS